MLPGITPKRWRPPGARLPRCEETQIHGTSPLDATHRLWLREGSRPLVFGHRGDAAHAPENTLRAIELALASGADGVELDVLSLGDGTLVLGHSLSLAELCHGAGVGDAGNRGLHELRALDPMLATLDEALELLVSLRTAGPLLIDLKDEGHEDAVALALRAHGLAAEALVCSLSRRSLRALAASASDVRRSLSYPRDRLDASQRPLLAPLVPPALAAMRKLLGVRIGRWLSETGAAAATLHHSLVTRELVARCHARTVAVVAWTVDDEGEARRLAALGADGIISNDPGLVTRILA
ncbi:MAG: glycerophosphodiester phosphodiesterase [Gaiellaceae bacterium]